MMAAIRSLVTSYCPLSLLTSPLLHSRVTAHRCTTPDVRPATITTRRPPTLQRSVASRRLSYLSTALTSTRRHCHKQVAADSDIADNVIVTCQRRVASNFYNFPYCLGISKKISNPFQSNRF